MTTFLYAHILTVNGRPAIGISFDGVAIDCIQGEGTAYNKVWIDLAHKIWNGWNPDAKARDEDFFNLDDRAEINLDSEAVAELQSGITELMATIDKEEINKAKILLGEAATRDLLAQLAFYKAVGSVKERAIERYYTNEEKA